MGRCVVCGSDVPRGTTTCPGCGSPFDDAEERQADRSGASPHRPWSEFVAGTSTGAPVGGDPRVQGPWAPPAPVTAPSRRRWLLPVALATVALVIVAAIGIRVATQQPPTTPRRGDAATNGTGATPMGRAFGRPAIAAGRVFSFEGQSLVARDLRSGAELWKVPVCATPAWADPTRANPTASLLVLCDRLLSSYVPTTGGEQWSITIPMPPPTVVRVVGEVILVGRGNGIWALDPMTGEVTGSYEMLPGVPTKPYPVDVRGGVVYIRSEAYVGGVLRPVLRIDAQPAGTLPQGNVVTSWTVPVTPTSVTATDDGVFVRSEESALSRIDETAHTVLWARPPSPPGNDETVVATTAETVVTRTKEGTLHAYDLATGDPRWSEPRSDAVAAGSTRVVTVGPDGLRVLDAVTGRVLRTAPSVRSAVPTVGDGSYAYVDGGTGTVVVRPLI